jgi:hypothetical protein
VHPSHVFLTENSEGDPAVEILLREKIFSKKQQPEIYNSAREAELLSKQEREETELLTK